MHKQKWWKSFAVAAVMSALASLLIVAVGPGFSQTNPNENAADAASEAAGNSEGAGKPEADPPADTASSSESSSNAAPGNSASDNAASDKAAAESTSTQKPHDPVNGNAGASTTPDTHGHVGAGTGTSTGSQADPGHKADTNGTDGKTNGPGTGDTAAGDCTNKHQGADAPQGGANNNPGFYDNTCDGRISQNGQGNDAPGKGTPCAGCVGNADDKNPPGQVREANGQKPNDMGYECDGNQGVGAHYGNGNPAHTGTCGTTTNPPPPPVCVDDPKTPKDECNPKPPKTCPDGSEIPPGGMKDCNPKPPKTCPDGSAIPPGGMKDCKAKPGKVIICHATGSATNPYVVIEISENALPAHLAHGDSYPTAAGCPTSPPPDVFCPADSDKPGVKVPPGQDAATFCYETKPGKVVVCHATGSATNPFVVIEISENALPAHLAHGDLYPVPASGCSAPPPPLCPAGSDLSGQPMPGGDVSKCYTTTPPPTDVCPAGTDKAGQPMPSGDVSKCNNPPVKLCPAGSDMAGLPIPGGDIRNCYTDTPRPTAVCPVGTDKAGQPMPQGDIRQCNDDVLGGIIDRDKDGDKDDDDVLGTAPAERERGKLLPFTGASLLAYLVLALELIGAGALIMRARKR